MINGISESSENGAELRNHTNVVAPARIPAVIVSPSANSVHDVNRSSASNSSWKSTMQPIIIGKHQLYPLTIEMEQRLILHYLIPTCEYQDVCYVLHIRKMSKLRST